MAESRKSLYLFAALLTAALLGIYLPGLHNELVFDDLRLGDGTIFGEYGSLLHFKQRMLSYGSFVWMQELFGTGWWKQRLVNLVLHMGVLAALYALLDALLSTARFPQEFEEHPHFVRSRAAALQVGIALFALNPVAVYAVTYLAQRSIVMATLFAVLACWMFVRGLQTGKMPWFAGALASYVLAVLSKEYAVMTAAMAVPLYIHVRRPGGRQVALMASTTLLLLVVAATVFWQFYGNLIGRVFDTQSLDMVRQLEALRPGITQHIYPLSILNEAALFFAYGFLWTFPNVLWMSIDMRPAFPLSFGSLPHLFGALAYLALLACAVWLVLRRRDLWALAALLLLFPLLWYLTEFATVWVQDPFVLYRSYLWAVALPGLLAIVLTGFKPRNIYILGAVLGLAFGTLALERVVSLQNAGTAWGDAAEKIDRNAPANTVGRSRAHLNLGSYHMEKGLYAQAERDFTMADALGDTGGKARFSLGVLLQQQKKYAQALQAFDAAQAKGYTGQSLYYQRGEAAFALAQFQQAYESFDTALRQPAEALEGEKQMEQLLQLRRAEAAIGADQFDAAIAGFTQLLETSPGNLRLEIGLGMALVGKGNTSEAIAIFNQLLARTPTSAAFYGRAMAYQRAGQHAQSLSDLDQAIRLDPHNPQYRAIRNQVAAAKKP